MKRLYKKLFSLGLPAALFLLILPHAAHGGWFENASAKVVANFILFPLFLMQYVGALLFVLANWVLQTMLNLNYGILKNNGLIETGWTLVRDLTNLGFVLVIIIIAISTIIRYEKYAMKALLPKLVGAAIIVNFSLTIAGIFIDFSHSMTSFFFEPLGAAGDSVGDVFGLPAKLAAAFRPQTLTSELESLEAFVPDDDANFFSLIVGHASSLIFVVIFTFLSAFTIFALAIMFFLRYVHLSFLLILSPIVWLFWVVPAFNKYHGEWWQAFMKWIIFGPAASLFIYLSLLSIERLSITEGVQADPRAFFAEGQIAGIMKSGINMFVLTGFFFGSIIVAQKIGVAGAAGAMGLANKAKGSAKKAAGNFAKQRAKNARDMALTWGEKTNERGESTTFAERTMGKIANNKIIRHTPFSGGFSRAGQNMLAKQKAGRAAATAQAQKSLAELSFEDLQARAALRTTSSTEKAAIAMELTKKGKISLLNQEAIKDKAGKVVENKRSNTDPYNR